MTQTELWCFSILEQLTFPNAITERQRRSINVPLPFLGRHTELRAWEVGRIARDLGVICEKTGRKREVVSYYESARKTWEGRLAAGSTTPEMYLDFASLYSSLGQ